MLEGIVAAIKMQTADIQMSAKLVTAAGIDICVALTGRPSHRCHNCISNIRRVETAAAIDINVELTERPSHKLHHCNSNIRALCTAVEISSIKNVYWRRGGLVIFMITELHP